MPEPFLPLGNYILMLFLLPDVNWLHFSIQRDDFEGHIDTIYNFETSSSKRFSTKIYESTKLQKPIYGPSRVQLLVQNLSLKKATNIG